MLEHIQNWRWKRLALFGAVFWGLIALFVGLADEVEEGDPLTGDDAILEFLYQFASPGLDQAAIIVTHMGGVAAVLSATAVVGGLLWQLRRTKESLVFLTTMATMTLMTVILKLVFARERPDLWAQVITETTYSFPSGHALLSSALAFSIMVLLWETRWRWLAIGLGAVYIFIIGLTRLYLGVHYPSDVIAGWSISGAWVLLVFAMLRGRAFLRVVPPVTANKPRT
jgi:undecaprenyl-diphosphatase